MTRRTLDHYHDLLRRNPDAGVGASLAAACVYAAIHGQCETQDKSTDECRDITRDLLARYGDNLTGDQIQLEMSAASIRTIRTRLGLTQADFAARIGVTTTTVSRWECGINRPTSRAHLRALDDAVAESVAERPEAASS